MDKDPQDTGTAERAESKSEQRRIELLPERYAVAKLPPEAKVPSWVPLRGFASVTRTNTELSLVCTEKSLPSSLKREGAWRCLRIVGPLDLSSIGILADLSTVLARARVSLFVVSTYDTDYFLVKERFLEKAIEALGKAGYQVS